MLSNSEKHFLSSWQEQREGPRWKYYLQFSVAWTVVSFLVLFFLLKLLTDREMGGSTSFWIVFPLAIIIGVWSTHLIYTSNEKRMKKIKEREAR